MGARPKRLCASSACTMPSRGNWCLAENIAQTLQFVQSGAADVGIVALSLASRPRSRPQGRYWEVPLDAYPRMEQGGVILKEPSIRRRRGVPRLSDQLCRPPDPATIRLLPSGELTWIGKPSGSACGWRSPTTAILLAIGLPLAYWLAFSRRRWKFLVEAVVALPLVLPPTVLGFYVLLAIGPRSPVGALYGRLTGGHAAVLVSGPAAGLGALQPAVHGAAGGRGVRRGGPQADRSFLVPGRFARGHFSPRHGAAGARAASPPAPSSASPTPWANSAWC